MFLNNINILFDKGTNYNGTHCRVSKNIDFFQKRTPIIWKPNQQSPEDIDSSTGETYTL
jgi:hypothetical protein